MARPGGAGLQGTANVLRRRMGLEPVASGWTALALVVLRHLIGRLAP